MQDIYAIGHTESNTLASSFTAPVSQYVHPGNTQYKRKANGKHRTAEQHHPENTIRHDYNPHEYRNIQSLYSSSHTGNWNTPVPANDAVLVQHAQPENTKHNTNSYRKHPIEEHNTEEPNKKHGMIQQQSHGNTGLPNSLQTEAHSMASTAVYPQWDSKASRAFPPGSAMQKYMNNVPYQAHKAVAQKPLTASSLPISGKSYSNVWTGSSSTDSVYTYPSAVLIKTREINDGNEHGINHIPRSTADQQRSQEKQHTNFAFDDHQLNGYSTLPVKNSNNKYDTHTPNNLKSDASIRVSPVPSEDTHLKYKGETKKPHLC